MVCLALLTPNMHLVWCLIQCYRGLVALSCHDLHSSSDLIMFFVLIGVQEYVTFLYVCFCALLNNYNCCTCHLFDPLNVNLSQWRWQKSWSDGLSWNLKMSFMSVINVLWDKTTAFILINHQYFYLWYNIYILLYILLFSFNTNSLLSNSSLSSICPGCSGQSGHSTCVFLDFSETTARTLFSDLKKQKTTKL